MFACISSLLSHRWPTFVAAAVCFSALLVSPELAVAQFTQQGPKLVGTGAVGTPIIQGYSVALSADGNTAIVGGYGDNNTIGAAWVYTRSNGVWTQQGGKLVGTGAVGPLVEQGYSVALSADGNTAIVGGPGDDIGSCPEGPCASGAAWVFTRSNGVWTQQGSKLVGTGSAGPAYQGSSVALSADGNTAIVGGDRDNIVNPAQGAVGVGAAWVFTRSNGVWTQQGGKLVGTGAVGQAKQGWSVALSGDGNTAIVGGPYDGGNGAFGVGAAWVFTRNGGVWTQQGSKLVGTGAVDDAGQGISVGLSADGNTAMVGGPYDGGTGAASGTPVGAAWVFTRSGGIWTQQGSKLVGTGAVGWANQGGSVALSADGNTAIVGGYGDGVAAYGAPVGAAWVFTRNGGVWTQQGNKLVGTGVVGQAAYQGWSVALSADGNTAIVGGWADNFGQTGAAWVFVQPGLQVTPPPT
jgi:hypothetical protein